jgi:aminopeptidase N
VNPRYLALAVATAMLAMVGSGITTATAHPTRTDAAARPTGGGPSYAAALSHPVADPYYPNKGTTSLDALHYGLDLTWDDSTRVLSGTATIRFRATANESSVSLDLGAPLHVTAVSLDGSTVSATHPREKLLVATGAIIANSRHTLVIAYHGAAAPVPAPTLRSDIPALGWTVQPHGQAWALQEPYGAFTWYPVNDQPSDKAFYDITWHTKSAWTGISNGQLMTDTVSGGERTTQWHLAYPAASYLVTADIGPYRAYHQTGPGGLPLTYWVRDADEDVLPDLRKLPSMLRWLEAHLGPYPFDRLSVVVAPTNSAEETETMITMGPSVMRSADPYEGLPDLLHEASHQWYGDAVTPTNWKDLWLNESFAMYIQLRWDADHNLGSMPFWRRQLNALDQQLRHRYGPPGAYNRRDFAELDVYYCGARMLDRLNTMLGPKLFARVLRDWPQHEKYGNADRADWIAYLDKTTGRNLTAFVTKWLTAKTSPK